MADNIIISEDQNFIQIGNILGEFTPINENIIHRWGFCIKCQFNKLCSNFDNEIIIPCSPDFRIDNKDGYFEFITKI